MDINLIITIAIYSLFFLGILIGGFWGLGRGLKKSSLRLGTLVLFVIIAGLITVPISRALLTIDLSSFNINVNGSVITTIPQFISSSLLSIEGFEEIATSMPSVMAFVEGLPVAIINLVVFFLLIFIMQFISWIVYIILAKTTLKECKIEKQIKKQRKLEMKLEKKNKGPVVPQPNDNKPKALPLAPPKKRRLLGALVGMTQAFILMFLVLIPITSLVSTAGEVLNTSTSILAEEGDSGFSDDLLTETVSDLIKNALGEDIISYFNSVNNSVPMKMLNLFGLNNAVFDSLTSVTVNNQGIAIRSDFVGATKVYDRVVSLRNQIDTNENWAELDFDDVRFVVGIVFDTGLFKAFAEDAIPFGIDMLEDSEEFSDIEYNEEISSALTLLIETYQSDSKGFLSGFKKDILTIVDIAESVFSVGLFDEIMAGNDDYNTYIEIVSEDDYALVTDIADKIFDSYLFRILTSKGLNIGLEIGSAELSNDGTTVNLGQTDYDQINWADMKDSFEDIITSGLEIFEILSSYNLFDNMDNPQDVMADISSEDINSLMSLLGEIVDLIKTSPLFTGQTETPFTGLVDWAGAQEAASEFIDTDVILDIASWKTELESLSSGLVSFKDCGALNYIITNMEGEMVVSEVIDMLLAPSSEEINADSYLIKIVSSVLDSPLARKPLAYGLNQANPMIEESLQLENELIAYENITENQMNELIEIVRSSEGLLNSLINSENAIDFENISTESIIDLLNSETLNDLGSILESFKASAFGIYSPADFDDEDFDLFLENYNLDGNGLFSNLYVSLIVKAGTYATDFVDSKSLLKVPSWETELNNLGIAVDYSKEDITVESVLYEGGVMAYLIDNMDSFDFETVIGMLQAKTDLENPESATYLNAMLTPVIDSSLTKKPLVYGLNQLNSILGDSLELTLNDFSYETFPDDQNDDIVNVFENVVNCFSVFNNLETFDLATIDTTKLAGLLTALQTNSFRIGKPNEVNNNGPINKAVNFTSKNVTNGGIFGNYYISLITYVLDDTTAINFKAVNWELFFQSAQGLSGNVDDIGEGGGSVQDLLDLSNPESQEDLSNLLDSLGLGQDEDNNGVNDLVEDLSTIQDVVAELSNPDSEMTEEEAYELINDALEGIINSTDGEGNSTIDTIVEMIEAATGDDTISSQISAERLANEQTVANRIHTLLVLQATNIYGVGLTSSNMEESIADLTCGANFVLQQAVDSETVILYNVETNDIITAVNETEAPADVKELVLNLFGITIG